MNNYEQIWDENMAYFTILFHLPVKNEESPTDFSQKS